MKFKPGIPFQVLKILIVSCKFNAAFLFRVVYSPKLKIFKEKPRHFKAE